MAPKHKARQESSPGPFPQAPSPTVPSGTPGAPPETSVPKPTAHPPRPTPTSAPLLGDPADNVNPANQPFTVASVEGEVEGEAEGEHVEPPPGALGCEGPIEDADTCPSCHKEVTYECDALQCDRCDRWWHLGACCGRKRFPPGHIDWFCSGCLPKA